MLEIFFAMDNANFVNSKQALTDTSSTENGSVLSSKRGTTAPRQREGWSVESQIFMTLGSTFFGMKLVDAAGAGASSSLGKIEFDGALDPDGGNEM